MTCAETRTARIFSDSCWAKGESGGSAKADTVKASPQRTPMALIRRRSSKHPEFETAGFITLASMRLPERGPKQPHRGVRLQNREPLVHGLELAANPDWPERVRPKIFSPVVGPQNAV